MAATPLNLPGITPQQAAYLATLNHANELVPKERGMLGGYNFNAPEIKFSTQNPREQVFVMVRAHPITNFGWILRAAISLVLPLLLVVAFSVAGFDLRIIPALDQLVRQEALVSRILALLALAYYSSVVTSMFLNFLNWYYNVALLTNERILDYNFTSLVSYEIIEAKLEKIEYVREKSVGFLPSLFGYGDVFVETAGQGGSQFDFIAVPRPSQVRNIIADLAEFTKRMFGNVTRF